MSEIKERVVYLLQRTDKIYDGTDIYVGSTSLSLERRLQFHRSRSKLEKYGNTKLYKKMCEVGLNNWEMISILSFTCDKKTILKFEKEKYYELNADLNTYSPFSGFENKKEYFANFRELNKQKEIYHCNICEKSFGTNWILQKHFNSLKHQRVYLNSVD